jgi:type IV pilus assembly protein PilV
MIEILISLIIIAIAMLGAAGVQLNVLRLNKGSQSRTQAIFLAADMAERMDANKAAAVAGNYTQVLTNASSVANTDCTAVPCDPPTLAAWDLSAWGQDISKILPQASWSITNAGVASPISYTIQIKWVDRSDVDSVATGAIVNSYTATRVIRYP